MTASLLAAVAPLSQVRGREHEEACPWVDVAGVASSDGLIVRRHDRVVVGAIGVEAHGAADARPPCDIDRAGI
jgi:hypothetical protein